MSDGIDIMVECEEYHGLQYGPYASHILALSEPFSVFILSQDSPEKRFLEP